MEHLTHRLLFEPARTGVLSWNSRAPVGLLEFRLLRAHAPATAWLAYAEWHPTGSKSFSPDHEGVHVEVDVIRAEQPFDGIEVRARGVDLELVAFSSPPPARPSQAHAAGEVLLDVPPRSQYVVANERGWCSPASLSMLLAYRGIENSIEETARSVFDRAYNGTGNWAFNVAFAGSLGLRAFVAHVQNLDRARRLIEADIPLAISYSWRADELPGAPLEHSDGHLAVLRGFTADGDCAMNDPAHPAVRTVYPREALERIWLRNDGIAYVLAPAGVDFAELLPNVTLSCNPANA
ncbi:MAG: C39 family peptidase [Candidatus Eremiobacteraeota bacterium]|nr:C39 family peptidase [Candidatus Eremiobacteraeota bacterium]